MKSTAVALFVTIAMAPTCSRAVEGVPVVIAEGQPLGANVQRLAQAMEYLGQPLPQSTVNALRMATMERDAEQLQLLLDPYVLFVVSLNPEVRVKVARGPATATLQQSGYTPHIVKVINNSTVTRQLQHHAARKSGPVYAGASEGILQRQAQTELNRNANTESRDRSLLGSRNVPVVSR